jgi:hypothetical protein
MLITAHFVKLVSDLSVVGGDKRMIGYYTGMIVRPIFNPMDVNTHRENRIFSRCHYIMPPKPSLCYNGAVFRITSGASLFF